MRDSTDRQIAELIRRDRPNRESTGHVLRKRLSALFCPRVLGPQGSDAQSGTAGGNGPAGPSYVPRMGVRSANSVDLQPPRPLLAEGQQIQS